MNSFTKFFHELLNPHCPHCKEEMEDSLICDSCETLKKQLEIVNFEKDLLLKRLLEKPETPIQSEPPTVTRPKMINWAVRRQMLEREDKERARVMKEAPKPISQSTEELEKELGIENAN